MKVDDSSSKDVSTSRQSRPFNLLPFKRTIILEHKLHGLIRATKSSTYALSSSPYSKAAVGPSVNACTQQRTEMKVFTELGNYREGGEPRLAVLTEAENGRCSSQESSIECLDQAQYQGAQVRAANPCSTVAMPGIVNNGWPTVRRSF